MSQEGKCLQSNPVPLRPEQTLLEWVRAKVEMQEEKFKFSIIGPHINGGAVV